MKRKAYFIVCIIIALVTFLVMSSCSNNEKRMTTEEIIDSYKVQKSSSQTYLEKEDLYFASGCDYSAIASYFEKNGVEYDSYYQILNQNNYGSVSSESLIRFYPSSKKFVIASTQQENKSDSDSGILYQYTYSGAITITFNQSLLDAKYNGNYSQQSVKVFSSGGAYYTVDLTFNNVKFVSLSEISAFDDITYSFSIAYADNKSLAQKHFNQSKDAIAKKCYSRISSCITNLSGTLKKVDSDYQLAGKAISQSDCSHISVTDKGYSATCTESGLTDGSHCKKCNKVLTVQQTIKAKGHTPVTDKGRAATCIEMGLSDGSHCSVCGTIIKEQVSTPCIAHNYSNGVCTVCSKKKPSENLSYTFLSSSNEYSVEGRGSCSDSILIIDEYADSKKVIGISKDAFLNDTTITELVIPKSIKWIGVNAFMNCVNLKTITYQGTTEEWANVMDVVPWYGIKATYVNCSNGVVRINTKEKG